MPIIILEIPHIDSRCFTHEYHSPFRHTIFEESVRTTYFQILEQLACNNDVVEIGCGVFSGLSELLFAYPFRSYVGVDKSVGDSSENHYPVDFILETAGVPYRYYRHSLPCVPTIPTAVSTDARMQLIYGMDFLTYLKDLASGSVVTLSTGFWHDKLLLDDPKNKEYVARGIAELFRVTKRGFCVGLHQFLYDTILSGSHRDITAGAFFREQMQQSGFILHPFADYHLNEFFWLEKP